MEDKKKRTKTVYIHDEYWVEAKNICQKLRPKKSFSRYLTEALVEKNDRSKKILTEKTL